MVSKLRITWVICLPLLNEHTTVVQCTLALGVQDTENERRFLPDRFLCESIVD